MEQKKNTPVVESLLALWDCRALAGLLVAGEVNPVWLFAGFKAEPASLEKTPVRRRLAREMDKREDLLLTFLRSPAAPWTEQRARIELLDENGLLIGWRELLRGTQNNLFLAAALAGDARPRVAARGLRLLRKRTYPWRLEGGDDRPGKDVGESLKQLLFPSLATDSMPREAVALIDEGRVKALQRQLEQANASNARLKADGQKWKSTCEKIAATEQAGDRQLKRDVTRLKSELAALHESAERKTAARLAAQRARIFGVDGDFERLRTAARTLVDDGLAAQAEAVLAAQAKLDVKYGTVHALARERERLLALRRDLDGALKNSIQPLPELGKTRHQVVVRLERLNQLLSTTAETQRPLIDELREAIVATSRSEDGMRQLNEATALLQGALADHLLAEDERQALLKTVAERKKWIAMLSREHSLAESLQRMTDGESAAGEPLAKDIWDVSFELGRLEDKPILLIDGYNVLKSTPALLETEAREGLPGARNKLLERLLAKRDSFSAIRVVYDGVGAVGTRERHAGIDLVFARERGEGQHADDDIVEWLATGKPADTPVWLATNDYGLRHRAARLCAGMLSVEDLATWLNLVK